MSKIEPKCKNCLLADREKNICKVAIIINDEKFNLPIFPDDNCHMDELGIPVQQVRWYVEDPITGEPAQNGIVKFEYPETFFEP